MRGAFGKFVLCAVLLTVLLGVTGCWNRRELNTLAIAVGMGIDKRGSEYDVSIQVVNPQVMDKKSGTNRSETIQFREHKATIFEALRKMTTVSPRKIYLSHLRILVLSEQVAREGINEVIDFISRDHEARTDFYIMVARGSSASEVLNVHTQLDNIPSIKVFDMLEGSEKAWAPTSTVRLDELIDALENDSGQSGVLSGVAVAGNKKKAMTQENIERIRLPGVLKYSGLAVFKQGKAVGWLNEEQSAAFKFIMGKVKNTVSDVPCPAGGKLVLEIFDTTSAMIPKARGGELSIALKQKLFANIGEVSCGIDLLNESAIEEIEKRMEEKHKRQLEETIAFVQRKYGADIFGFGQSIHRSYPREWKKVKANWSEAFRELPVTVSAQVTIRRTGTINNAAIPSS
ncbi:hypothetical protein B1A99_17570 [Cohnella sp. CIP 111063]|uniref:Ger(x)C family spore germination protein n=1 Tax=unclassified Cohnella TaxID=2636738 RepID=UPI000B8C222A|nr:MULTISPECIES: Ger(x)C family spore germination protein [unclassified Cohnella]OXS57298.1 hypothetical protein B1A99_17570 [Cohnella sp. CIP 111063]PRX70738.1 spore germination protein KC [Cohnella sp. SGD-V74]